MTDVHRSKSTVTEGDPRSTENKKPDTSIPVEDEECDLWGETDAIAKNDEKNSLGENGIMPYVTSKFMEMDVIYQIILGALCLLILCVMLVMLVRGVIYLVKNP